MEEPENKPVTRRSFIRTLGYCTGGGAVLGGAAAAASGEATLKQGAIGGAALGAGGAVYLHTKGLRTPSPPTSREQEFREGVEAENFRNRRRERDEPPER